MSRSAIFLVLCLALAISPSASEEEEVTKCLAPGALVCDADCSNLVVCLGETDTEVGPFREVSVETCDSAATSPTFCYSPAKRCESRSSCDAVTEFEFECTTSGQLPHPTDCTKFYVCAPDGVGGFTAHEQLCEEGYAYNASRGFCNLPLSHPTCINGPVPQCADVGAVGSLPENTSIYYLCKRRNDALQPVLYVCKHGGVFVDETATCVPAIRSPEDDAADV